MGLIVEADPGHSVAPGLVSCCSQVYPPAMRAATDSSPARQLSPRDIQLPPDRPASNQPMDVKAFPQRLSILLVFLVGLSAGLGINGYFDPVFAAIQRRTNIEVVAAGSQLDGNFSYKSETHDVCALIGNQFICVLGPGAADRLAGLQRQAEVHAAQRREFYNLLHGLYEF